MKKTIHFTNPFKEALNIDGKRMTVAFIVTISLMAALAIVASILGMKFYAIVATVVVVAVSVFLLYHYGVEIVSEEE